MLIFIIGKWIFVNFQRQVFILEGDLWHPWRWAFIIWRKTLQGFPPHPHILHIIEIFISNSKSFYSTKFFSDLPKKKNGDRKKHIKSKGFIYFKEQDKKVSSAKVQDSISILYISTLTILWNILPNSILLPSSFDHMIISLAKKNIINPIKITSKI